MPIAAVLAVMAGVCLYQALARRFGPGLIDEKRYTEAREALKASGDGHTKPMPVLLTTAMCVMFLIDGAFSGFSLTTTAFASLFSPRVAMFASILWSCATAWLLYHLTSAAAREAAINARRTQVRNLLASGRDDDRQRAQAMLEHIGHALGNDCSRKANRYRARVLLALVVLGLSVATLVVRVSSENSEAQLEHGASIEAPRIEMLPPLGQ
jgi:hypothetical protein